MSNILSFVPSGVTLRPVQVKALLDVEAAWSWSEVIVIPGDVGFGKSIVAYVIAAWQRHNNKSTAIITPRVLLQEQYAEAFTDLPVLKGRDRYDCITKGVKTCKDYNEFCERYCEGCPYLTSKTRAVTEPIGVFNFQSYTRNKVSKEVLVIDEAHNTIDFLSDNYTLNVWKKVEKCPENLNTHGDIAIWLEKRIKQLKAESYALSEANKSKRSKINNKIYRYQQVIDGLVKAPTNFFIEHTTDYYRGKEQPLLRVRPITVKYVPHTLWPRNKVSKVVLLSATINNLDIDRLGLSRRRVTYLNCENPIPADRRPFVVDPAANMAWKYQAKSLPLLAKKIEELSERHKGEKGIIHIPYSLAYKLKQLLSGDRYLWHTRDNKDTVYQQFRNSEDDAVLVACGMSEGIDLVEEYGRWQVIAKIMYPSLADALVKKQLQEDPIWYNWVTARTIRQQCGRITRSPTDFGVTYMVDAGFRDFFRRTRDMWPQAFVDSMREVK